MLIKLCFDVTFSTLLQDEIGEDSSVDVALRTEAKELVDTHRS